VIENEASLAVTDGDAMHLIGRRIEVETIDRLLVDARGGAGGSLLLWGQAGIGKTALLEHAVVAATGFQVARIAGTESEMEMGFAGIHQLTLRFENRMTRLPPKQRHALRSVFGLDGGTRPDRFLVGLAVLTLLADVAKESPLLCLVDDADWLDRESLDVLAFVGRRLVAERIVLLFAARAAPTRSGPFVGLPALIVNGMTPDEVREWIAERIAGPVDGRVADSIISTTEGNPLGLLELTSELTPAQLAGAELLPDPLPIGGRVREMLLRRVQALPDDTQSMLLLAAANTSDDPQLLWRASRHRGLSVGAIAPAEADRLISLGSTVAFRHPLIRSAVYHGAPPGERRRAHEALAAASDAELYPDQRAFHLGAAATGPDQEVAEELSRSADRWRSRGSYASAGAFLWRAAELTPDPELRTSRMFSAVEAELNGGFVDRAQFLLNRTKARLAEPDGDPRALRLQGAIYYAQGRLAEAPALLLQAAQAMSHPGTELATETLLEAIQATIYGGRFAGDAAAAIGREASRLATDGPAPQATGDLLLQAFATVLTSGRVSAMPGLRAAVSAMLGDELRTDDRIRLSMLGCLAASEAWDDMAQHTLASRWVAVARDHGALTALPVALNYLGWYEAMEGRSRAAEAHLQEGQEISMAVGNPGVVGASGAGYLLHLVLRGREPEAREAAAAMTRDGVERNQGASLTHAASALTVLEVSLGRYSAALAHARQVYEEDLFYLGSLILPELIEAGVRAGDRAIASAALGRLRDRALAAGTPWALGLLARSEALLTDDGRAEPRYAAAIESLKTCRVASDLARAHLLYGEWLRRVGRRVDAREQLRRALELFSSMDFGAFAERARIELAATGEHARKRTPDTQDQLTPQETQIGRMVVEGARNQEIAAQLFISSSTVEYHLGKIFRKLGVSSRTQLARMLAAQGRTLEPAGT
jgi:DNA-binding CsgD family transcriptional regulator